LKYKLFIEKAALKELSKISHKEQPRIISAIKNLSKDPKPPGVKKLTGRDAWRIRVGSYRIIYEIHDDNFVIIVVHIGHRKDIYCK
jgi:mRNA interferase RelE/StbE